MDEIKKYLFENRDELDLERAPRPQVWKYVQRETSVVKKPVVPLYLKWAAAAAILVAVSTMTWWWVRPAAPQTTEPELSVVTPKINNIPEPARRVGSSTGTSSQPEIDVTNPELPGEPITAGETRKRENRKRTHKEKQAAPQQPASPLDLIEDNYASIINYQVKKLEKTPIYIESAGYFHLFKKQWLDLERDEKKVKQDVRLYGLNDNLVNQLIQLYQQKLWLLKELQTEINKMNVRASQHPDIKRIAPAFLKL